MVLLMECFRIQDFKKTCTYDNTISRRIIRQVEHLIKVGRSRSRLDQGRGSVHSDLNVNEARDPSRVNATHCQRIGTTVLQIESEDEVKY